MTGNNALIPLYLNSSMAKNILTILVHETVEKQSISIKDQLKVNIKTPLNELAYNVFGQHMQGEVSIEAASEFANQFSREIINTDILVFLKARDELRKQGLLKDINNESDISRLKENDYVDVYCDIKPNPAIERVESIINRIEMQKVLNLNSINAKEADGKNMEDILALLRDNMNQYKKEKCLRLVGDNIPSSKSKIIVPMHMDCMLDNMDYIFDGKSGVMGKVVKVVKNTENNELNLLKGTCFEHFTENHFRELINVFLPNYSINNENKSITVADTSYIEVLPILIYV